MTRPHIHFVTGRLAEFALRDVLHKLAPRAEFEYSVGVLPITVAALMSPAWIAARIQPPPATTKIMLPGYCSGDLAPVEQITGKPVERGPKDLQRLPEFFGQQQRGDDYGGYDIQIIAEINHAPRLPLSVILATARRMTDDGADLIDVGCEPGDAWTGVADVVRALRDAGHRVSIDSLNPAEIAPAVKAGCELVLSVNSSNRDAAADWNCEVVVVPDVPSTLAGLDETVEFLAARRVPLRIDPVLEPIGFGFAESLGRYLNIRHRYPDAEMMMGIGNLTELTDVDSAGINVLLLGFCQELGIRSVLTTEVINWARTSVRECDLARRLMHYAVSGRRLPKHLESRLVTLRDPQVSRQGDEVLQRLAQTIKDHNIRLFAEDGTLQAISAGLQLSDANAFVLFEKLQAALPRPVDAAHAFYLGYELAKATTANTLGKQYRQDEALDWGYLTQPEVSHRQRRAPPPKNQPESPADEPAP